MKADLFDLKLYSDWLGYLRANYSHFLLACTVVYLNKLSLNRSPVLRNYIRYLNDELVHGEIPKALKILESIGEISRQVYYENEGLLI